MSFGKYHVMADATEIKSKEEFETTIMEIVKAKRENDLVTGIKLLGLIYDYREYSMGLGRRDPSFGSSQGFVKHNMLGIITALKSCLKGANEADKKSQFIEEFLNSGNQNKWYMIDKKKIESLSGYLDIESSRIDACRVFNTPEA